MAQADYVYIADLDTRKVEEAFKRVDKLADNLQAKLQGVFDGFGVAAKNEFQGINNYANQAFRQIKDGSVQAGMALDEVLEIAQVLKNTLETIPTQKTVTVNIEQIGDVVVPDTVTAQSSQTTAAILSEPTITTPDLSEAEQQAQRIQEVYTSLVGTLLRVATTNDEASRSFLNMAQSAGATGDVLLTLVKNNTNLSDSLIQNVQTATQAEAAIRDQIETLDQTSDSYATQINAITELNTTRQTAIAAIREELQAQQEAAQQLAFLESLYDRLFAKQLELISSNDSAALGFVKIANAAGATGNVLLDLVDDNTNLSESLVRNAQLVAEYETELRKAIGAIDEESDSYDDQLDAIQQINDARQTAVDAIEAELQVQKDAAAARVRAEREAAQEQIRAQQEAAAAQRVAAQERQQAERRAAQILKANIRANKEVRGEVAKLVAQEGQLNVKLGQNTTGFSRNEQQVLKTLKSNSQLRQVIQNLEKQYGKLDITLDQLDFPSQTKKTGSFTDSLKGLGTRIGLTATITTSLINAFRNLARSVSESIQSIIKNGSELATQFELTQAALELTLKIDTAQAQGAFEELRRLSEQFGVDATSIISAFGSQITDFSQLEGLIGATLGLGTISEFTGKRATESEIKRAIAEVQSGDPRTLQRIFELVPSETEPVLQGFRESFDAGLEALNKVLEDRGFDLEKALDTVPVKLTQVQERLRTVLGDFGIPINEEFKNFLDGLIGILEENKDGFREIANAAGEFVATLVRLFTGGTIDSFNELFNVEAIVDGFQRGEKILIAWGGVFENVIQPALRAILDLFNSGLLGSLRKSIKEAGGFSSVLITAQRLFVVVLYAIQQAIAGISETTREKIAEAFELLTTVANSLGLNYLFPALVNGAEAFSYELRNVGTEESKLKQAIDGTIASLEEQEAAFAAIEGREYVPPVAETPDIPDRPVQFTDVELETLQRRLEIEKDFIQRQLDLEIQAQQDRVDLAQKLSDKLAEIERKRLDDIEDAYIDRDRALRDLATEYADKEEDLAQESADKRLEIEKDYLRKLEELRRKFQFSAEEAVRQNDAIRFLQLKRQLEFDKREARIRRDQQLEDLKDTEGSKRDELAKERERERRDIQQDLLDKLDDIALANQRQIREAQIGYKEDLRNLIVSEERKLEELKKSYALQLEEFKTFQAEKEGDILTQLENELAIIEDLNSQITNTEDGFYADRISNFKSFVADYETQIAALRTARMSAATAANQVMGSVHTGGIFNPNFTGGGGAHSGGFFAGASASSTQRLIDNVLSVYSRISDKSSIPSYLRQLVTKVNTLEQSQLMSLAKELMKYTKPGGRAFGGNVFGGTPYIVGERGPELFMPSFSGQILPLMNPRNFALNVPYSGGSSNTVNNQFSNNFSMLDPSKMSPAQMEMIGKFITEIMFKVAQGI